MDYLSALVSVYSQTGTNYSANTNCTSMMMINDTVCNEAGLSYYWNSNNDSGASYQLSSIADNDPLMDSASVDDDDIGSVETFWKDIYSKNNLQPGFGWKIPQYYSLPYQVIGTIFQGIIFIIGKFLI